MKLRLAFILLVLATLQNSSLANSGQDDDPNSISSAGDQEITNLLTKIREKSQVPAIAAAIISSKGLTSHGVVGVRKKGTNAAVTLKDKWHLGSNTKAMTATLVAKLVENGVLKWETTIGEVFPKLSEQFHPDMKSVTIVHLLSHRAGLKANLALRNYLGESEPERLRAVKHELANAPLTKPGSTYRYSNLGYIIAGAMIEKLTGKSWEKNMTEHIFKPLNMKDTGFGGVGTPGKIDQPWGHTAFGNPVGKNGPSMDNPPVMGPTGRVHCTMQDWAKFITDQLRGARGQSSILKNSSYKILHKPPFGGTYALGWMALNREWGGGTVLTHSGSNSMNFATVWIAPKRDFAVIVCVNQGGNSAMKACNAAVTALVTLHMKKVKAARKKSSNKSN